MSDTSVETTPTVEPTAVQMSPEVTQARDALVSYERNSGDAEFADKFAEMTFDTPEDVYKAYGAREATTGDPAPPEGTEELLLGKFKSQEDLAKAYQELEKKLGQPPAEPKVEPTDTQGDLEITPEPEGGLLDQLNEHYAENGSLTDEHYQTLAKAGLNKADVDKYIQFAQAGAQAQASAAQAAEAELKQSVGGPEAYNKMTAWAAQNLSGPEIEAFNKATSGDPAIAKMAIENLSAKHKAAVGSGDTSGMVSGAATTGNAGLRGFESEAEIVAAMSDPRMDTHPSYRREVEQRMVKTQF